MTQREMRAAVKALGLTCRVTEFGDIRVAWPGPDSEDSAYYTTDRKDAVDTAYRMAEWKAHIEEMERAKNAGG